MTTFMKYMRILGRFAPFLALFAVAVVPARSQMNVNPLDFEYVYPRIGADIGLSSVWQSGTYIAGCGRFETGAQINPVFALAYDHPISNTIRFEALLGYQGRSVSSSYNSRENVVLQTTNDTVPVEIDFENIGNARFSYAFLLPSVKIYLAGKFFAGAGISANLLLSSSTQYTKNILSKTVMLDDLPLSEVYYQESESSDPYSKVFPEEAVDPVNGFGLDGVIYAGGEFEVAKGVMMVPRVLMTIPLMPVIPDPELKLMTLQFLIGARFNLYQ
jgi:hypothetical protein